MIATIICFVVCHSAPADHMAVFAQQLSRQDCEVRIYATGPAVQKLQESNSKFEPFLLDEEEKQAILLAKKCSEATLVITDVGDPFDVALQRALARWAPQAVRYAYYDNPEAYVPGGYSKVAAQVMQVAERVLFANANLASRPLYREIAEEVSLPSEKKIGLGYYPMERAEAIRQKRLSERMEARAKLFTKQGVQDRGQTLLVYAGGNNEEYFSRAFPAFLSILQQADLPDVFVLLQQHPGAKSHNLDLKQVPESLRAQLWVSEISTEEAQIAADGMLYYQTSLAAQFVLAGIPTIQVSHAVYADLLVKEGLCSVVTNVEEFCCAISVLDAPSEHEVIEQGLGLRVDWAERLKRELLSCEAKRS